MTGEAHVGEVVRRLRRALDLTQRDLAHLAHCATGTIRRIESGDLRPSRQLAVHLAIALRIPEGDREAFARLARQRDGEVVELAAHLVAGRDNGPVSVLPVPLGALLGRDHAVAAVAAVLGEVRLLTLTGPPGVGKTTLAVAAARVVEGDHADGVVWVPLADVPAEDLVPAAIARAAGLQVGGDGREVLTELVAALRSRRHLLVLDNVEHLPRLAEQVTTLLAQTTGVCVLATGRSALRAQSEQEFPVQPLAEAAAVDLFLAQARAVMPDLRFGAEDLDAVAAICRRLDGLPLAVELAARRLRVLTPRELLAALSSGFAAYGPGRRDAPARQTTMQDAVAWSYRLLSAPAASALERLSVFAGGATLPAVASLCADPDLVATGELVEHNLVLVEPGLDGSLNRVRTLEVVRAYAAARLREHGDDLHAHESHLRWAAELARSGAHGLAGPDQPRWLLELDAEVPNLIGACTWAGAAGHPEDAAVVVGDLWWFWWASGRWAEARALTDGVRAHRPALSSRSRAQVDFTEAHLAFLTGDLARTRRVSSSLARAEGSPLEAAYAACFLHVLDASPLAAVEAQLQVVRDLSEGRQHLGTLLSGCGLVALVRGSLDVASSWIAESAEVYAELGQPYGQGVTDNLAGDLARHRGDLHAAAGHYASAIDSLRDSLVRPDLPAALTNLADVRLALGAVEDARELLVEALGLQWRLASRLGQARCLNSLAYAETLDGDGDAAEAALLLAAAHACFGADHPMSTPTTFDLRTLTDTVRGRLAPLAWATAWEHGHEDPDACIRRMIAR